MSKRNFKDIINKAIFIDEEDEEVVPEVKKKAPTSVKFEPKKVEPKVAEPTFEKLEKVEPVKKPEVKPEPAPVVKPQRTEPQYAATVISNGTKIAGDITCKADLQIEGVIEGNIICDKAVTIKGKVRGNIKANSLTTIDATIDGNVNCGGMVNILGKTTLKGDVNSSDVVLEGEISGNIVAENKVSLKGASVLDGNTTSAKIMVEEGATIIGSIQTIANKKVATNKN